MDLLLILLVLFGIPAVLLILVGTWGLKRAGKEKWARLGRKYLLIGVGVVIVGIMIADWVDRNHFRSFSLDDQHEVRLRIEEIPSFLDQPTAFYIKIIGPHGKSEAFYFEIGDGSQLRFYKSEKYSIMRIEDLQYIEGRGWFLDYEGNEILESDPRTFEENADFELIAELGLGLVLKEKH